MRVTKRDCLLCFILWVVSLAGIPAGALMHENTAIIFTVIFLFMAFCGIKSGFFLQRREDFSNPFAGVSGRFEVTVLIISVVCMLLAGGALMLLVCYGGSPTETAEGFATVNHNVVKRIITESEYRFLCIAEGISFPAAECVFTGAILIHARREAGLSDQKRSFK